MSDTVLVDLQADIVERLLADDYFSDIAVLSERTAELDYEIGKALGIVEGRDGKCGVLVLVQQPVANDEMLNVQFGALVTEWNILVLEETKLNRATEVGTSKPALAIARRVARVLKLTEFGGNGRRLIPGQPFIAPSQAAIDTDSGLVVPIAYSVKFVCAEADSEAFTKVARPTITPAGGLFAVPVVVTLACSTAGASIYYTTDDSYPRAGGAGSTLYASPITISAACQLRVSAQKTSSIASDVVAADFTA